MFHDENPLDEEHYEELEHAHGNRNFVSGLIGLPLSHPRVCELRSHGLIDDDGDDVTDVVVGSKKSEVYHYTGDNDTSETLCECSTQNMVVVGYLTTAIGQEFVGPEPRRVCKRCYDWDY